MLNIYTQTLSMHTSTQQHVSIMKHHKTSFDPPWFCAHPHALDDTVLCYKYSSDHLCLVVRASVVIGLIAKKYEKFLHRLVC